MTSAFAKQILQGIAGPAGAVDNAIARFDGITGKKIQSSNVTIDDAGNIVLGSIIAGIADYDKFVVSDGGQLKYRTGAQVLSDIGAAAAAHLHDGDTLQLDGINSDGGAFAFNTTGQITFNQNIKTDKDVGVGITPTGRVHVYGNYKNVAPDGTMTVSSTYAGTDKANLVDGDIHGGSGHWSSNNAIPAWIKIDHGVGVTHSIEKYRIFVYSAHPWIPTSYSPDDWKLKGSNEAAPNADPTHADWTDLDTQTNEDWTVPEWKEYTPSVTTAYRHHCLYITKSAGGSGYVYITELQLLSSDEKDTDNTLWIDPATGRFVFGKSDTAPGANVIAYFEGLPGGQLLAPIIASQLETAAHPPWSFIGKTNYGLGVYGNYLLLILGGNVVKVGDSFFYYDKDNGFCLSNSNTVASPTFALKNDTDTGMYFPAANTIGFSCGNSEKVRIDSDGNVLIGTVTAPASMTKGLAMVNGVIPTGDVANQFSMYSADQVAGNACPHIRTENGAVIKLHQAAKANYNNWAALGDVVNALVAIGLFDTA